MKDIPELDQAIASLVVHTAITHRTLMLGGMEGCQAAELTTELCELVCADDLKVLRDYAQHVSVETCLQYIQAKFAQKGYPWTDHQQFFWVKTVDPEGYKDSQVFQNMLHRN